MQPKDSLESATLPAVRANELAEAMGVSVRTLADELEQRSIAIRGGADRVEASVALELLSNVEPVGDMNAAESLVKQAFLSAKASGKPDWQVMTGAVLKNRLLEITKRGFNEADYGAPNMTYFVGKFPHLIELATNASGNPVVRVKEDALSVDDVEAASPVASFGRLREDIWYAFFDYRKHSSYVWDVHAEVAVPGEPGPSRLLIPSMTAQDEQQIRRSFRDGLRPQLADDQLEVIESWVENRSGNHALPPVLRGQWNGYVRRIIIERAEQFFSQHGLAQPNDLTADRLEPGRKHSSEAELRSFALRCVAVMTVDELNELRFGPSVALRAFNVHQS